MLLLNLKRNLSDARFQHCYYILKVPRKATKEEIKDSFYSLSKLVHPDNVKTGNQYKFIRLKEAYQIIKDAPLASTKLTGPSVERPEDLTYRAFIERRRYDKLKHKPNKEPELYR